MVQIGQRLVELGERVYDGHWDEALRSEVVRMCAMSQSKRVNEGRSPTAFRAWCVAHELGQATGSTKTAALARVLAAVHSLPDERSAWAGDPRRRQEVLKHLFPDDHVSTALDGLRRRWRLPTDE